MALLKGMTIKEATQHWVRGLNAIPQQFIVTALGDNLWDTFTECTPDIQVCSYCGEEASEDYIERKEEDSMAQCEHCASDADVIEFYEYQSNNSDYLPMWGTMWTLGDSFDEDWFANNLETAYRLGFRVYEHEDLGIVIGIDGAGYDFYEEHWIPLYKALGLRWHDTD